MADTGDSSTYNSAYKKSLVFCKMMFSALDFMRHTILSCKNLWGSSSDQHEGRCDLQLIFGQK